MTFTFDTQTHDRGDHDPRAGRRRGRDHGERSGFGGRGPGHRRGGPGVGPGMFGPGFPFAGPGEHGGPGRHGGRRRRPRGDVRVGILLLLAEGPQNGYGLIRELAERSGGAWTPSSGAVYPALAQLEDEGLVEPDEESGRKHLRLTDEGRAVAESLRERTSPWDEAAQEYAVGPTTREVQRSFQQLALAVRAVAETGDEQLFQRAGAELEATRRRLYGLLADPSAAEGEHSVE